MRIKYSRWLSASHLPSTGGVQGKGSIHISLHILSLKQPYREQKAPLSHLNMVPPFSQVLRLTALRSCWMFLTLSYHGHCPSSNPFCSVFKLDPDSSSSCHSSPSSCTPGFLSFSLHLSSNLSLILYFPVVYSIL